MKKNKKAMVWAKLPKAGLGNKILVWARAVVFAHKHQLPVVTTNWVSLHIGPLLRGEKSKRFYLGYFRENSLWEKGALYYKKKFSSLVNEPDKAKLNEVTPDTIYVFHKPLFWIRIFDKIKSHREVVINRFFNDLLKNTIKEHYQQEASPEIGIHIRRGDFPTLENHQEFGERRKMVQTPMDFFIKLILNIRKIKGEDMPVTIFSDGSKQELLPVLELNNVYLAENNVDIIDLLKLSKSKIIIPSCSSTFSLLAAFLSEAIILHHPGYFMRPIRPVEINERVFEGKGFDNPGEWPEALKIQIRNL